MVDLKERILEIAKKAEDALSVGDFIEVLGEDFNVKPSALRQALAELEKEHRIIALPKFGEGEGRPKNLYRPVTEQALGKSSTREDFAESLRMQERKHLLRELIEDSTGRYSTLPLEKMESIFSDAATRLLKENPRNLFLKFAEWLKNQHDTEVSKFKSCKEKGQKADMQEHEEVITRLEDMADSVFARMLGVPKYLREGESSGRKAGPFLLSLDKRSCDCTSRLDANELKRYLELSVHGDQVIERIKIGDVRPPIHVGGSDSSVQPISLWRVLPWFTESADMNIITAVGVRYDIYKAIRDYERYPDPRALAQYERRQAIEEGLLIPPAGTLGFPSEMENRIKEAAMDLRQYRKDFELMFEKEPACRVHFRDGRIFPYEHYLSDALQHGLHGEIVRHSLKTFRNIVNAIGAEGGDTLFCGFVKRAGVDILAPLILWYIGFGSADADGKGAIDSGMTLRDFLRSPEGDSWIVSNLFSSIRKSLSQDEVFVTFRILRSFQSLEEPYVRNFQPSPKKEEWENRLRPYRDEIAGEDTDETGVSLVATLCARASILEFYCSLSGRLDPRFETSILIPRFEVLLPYPDIESLHSSNGSLPQEKAYVKRVLGVIYHPGMLDRYPDTLNIFSKSPRIFLAPKPVCDAHISAKEIADVYKDDFIELLVREAKIYWFSLKGVSK